MCNKYQLTTFFHTYRREQIEIRNFDLIKNRIRFAISAVQLFLLVIFFYSIAAQAEPAQYDKECCREISFFVGYSITDAMVSNQYTLRNETTNADMAGFEGTARLLIDQTYLDLNYLSQESGGVFNLGDSYNFSALRLTAGYKLVSTRHYSIGINAGISQWDWEGNEGALNNLFESDPLQKIHFSGHSPTYGVNFVVFTNKSKTGYIAVNYQKFPTDFGDVNVINLSMGAKTSLL